MSEEGISVEEVVKQNKLKRNCPKINWGPDFEERPTEEKLIFLKKFADSFNYALAVMQEERDHWMDVAKSMEKRFLDVVKQLNSQKAFVQKLTTDQNSIKQAYQEKINALEAKLRKVLE